MVFNNDKRVVREKSGEFTGDRIIIDNEGTEWKVVTTLSERATGDSQAVLMGDKIREK